MAKSTNQTQAAADPLFESVADALLGDYEQLRIERRFKYGKP